MTVLITILFTATMISGCATLGTHYAQPEYMMNAADLCNGNVKKFDPNSGRFECHSDHANNKDNQ